ncbi:hypothetical protein CK203_112477 [Vitis vinifera]|uniref:Uncharacterized protein n=1 Tax=Vitis vinifera TaxID=29760 RepID=A0A438C4G6_VITVI|nr:hypothetical protein CK203_112477 [Vitis vinifera]
MQDKLNESHGDLEEGLPKPSNVLATLQGWRREEILPLFNKEEAQEVSKEEIPKLNLKPLPMEIGSSRWGCNYGDACFPNRKWTSESAPKVRKKTADAVLFASLHLLHSLHTLNDFGKGLWSSKAWFFMNLIFQKLFHNLSK